MEELRVPLRELETSDEDIYRDAVYQGRPFTGVAWGKDGEETCEIPYADGTAHGRCRWWYKNGKLSLDELVDHGEVVESTSWYPPGDAVHSRCAGGERRYWFRDGTLALERGEGWSREYYPSGGLREERRTDPDGGTRSVWYGEDGEWAVRTKTGPREPGKRLPPDPDIDYNDAYIRAHYLELLRVPAFGHHFLDWLFRQMEPKKSWFRRWVRDDRPKVLSAEGRRMVCAMIQYEDLRVKYRGVTMAGQYRVEEARPFLEQALPVKQKPPGEYSVAGGGTDYAWTVGEAAANALRKLGTRNQGLGARNES